MTSRLDSAFNALTLVTSGAAIILVGLVLRRNVIVGPGIPPPARPTVEAEWERYARAGTRIGRSDAAVSLVVFSDLECPFCRRLHQAVDSLIGHDSSALSMTFVHSPISSHRFALPAARAVECAKEQGRFPEMLHILFTRQDSLGLLSWGAFADRAGVADTAQLVACQRDQRPLAAIDDGQAASAKANIAGTPTVIINGWRFPAPPSRDTIDAIVKRVRAGQSVY